VTKKLRLKKVVLKRKLELGFTAISGSEMNEYYNNANHDMRIEHLPIIKFLMNILTSNSHEDIEVKT